MAGVDPLTDVALIARLISEVSGRDEREVMKRLRREYERPGVTVVEDAQRRNVIAHARSEAMSALYSESDAFLFESAVWNRNKLKCAMRRRVRRHVNDRRKTVKRDALDVLVVGDGPGFDSLDLARAGHNVTYHELPGFQEAFARRLFHECGTNIRTTADRTNIERGSFDAVVCLDVLEHVDNPPESVRALIDYLREDGIFLVHAPFYMVHPAYPTHLRSNRRFSGSLRLYKHAGLRLVHGAIGWNPLVFARESSAIPQPFLKWPRHLAIHIAGAFFALGRWTSVPFVPIHMARRLNGRWFRDGE